MVTMALTTQAQQTILWFPATHPKWDEDGWARPYGDQDMWWFVTLDGYGKIVSRHDLELTGVAVPTLFRFEPNPDRPEDN